MFTQWSFIKHVPACCSFRWHFRSLRYLYNVFSSCPPSFPQLLPDPRRPFPPNFVSFELVLFKYSWTCGLPQECGWLSRGFTLREHWPLSSQQPTVANSSVNRCRTSHPASLFMLGLGLAWTCTGRVTSLHPVWFRKTLLPCGPLLPLALTFLPL